MQPDGFRNRHDRFTFLIAREHARLIRANPALLQTALRFLDELAPDCRSGEQMWRDLLARGVEPVVSALTDRSPAGDYARETAPSFGGLPAAVRRELLARATQPLQDAVA